MSEMIQLLTVTREMGILMIGNIPTWMTVRSWSCLQKVQMSLRKATLEASPKLFNKSRIHSEVCVGGGYFVFPIK